MKTKNHVLRPIISKCMFMYFNDILLCDKNEEERTHHSYQLLTNLSHEKLCRNLKMCHFYSPPQVILLWYVVSAQDIHVDDS